MEQRSAAQSEVTPAVNPETVHKEIAIQRFKTAFLVLNIIWCVSLEFSISLLLLWQLVPNWIADLNNQRLLLIGLGAFMLVAILSKFILIDLFDRNGRWRSLLSGKEKIKFILIGLTIGLIIPAITLVIVFFSKL